MAVSSKNYTFAATFYNKNNKFNHTKMEKKDLLKQTIEHIDIKKIDSTDLIDAMRGMSFSSRDTANAADIFQRMMND